MALPWLGGLVAAARTAADHAPTAKPADPPPAEPRPVAPHHIPCADLPRMAAHEKMRLRAAAARAHQVLPAPIAELVGRELLAYEEFGYRLGAGSPVMRATAWVMTAPRWVDPEPAAGEAQ